MDRNELKENEAGLAQLIGRLKSEDSNYAHLSRFLQIMYWIFVPVFLFAAYRQFAGTGDYEHVLADGCKLLAFLIFAIFFGNYYKEYKHVDYSVPTLKMLKSAANRYKPLHGKLIWIVVAFILLDIGFHYNELEQSNIIVSQLLFIGAILIAVIAGLLVWYIRYKPLRDDVLHLIAEIEEK